MNDHLAEGFVNLEVFRSDQDDKSFYLLLFVFSKCNEYFSVESNEQKLLWLDLLFVTKILVYIKDEILKITNSKLCHHLLVPQNC